MAKHSKKAAIIEHDNKRGTIKDNALKALVTSELFKMRVEKPKKGKGSYNRKHKGHKLKGDAPFDFLARAFFINKSMFLIS
ncbi:ribosome alternative rescue factor ArfA [Shewanella sp. UCD-KL12]|uniref:ribosome alternative rescue factor ArfA n=1 Tax=Shewanella sp. UCD-KL12 TaxID=1917163 RepID=UPI0009710E8E|nr:ribosome alternative rescue factor ArfA [Shewanella sp. UCD-KL12]